LAGGQPSSTTWRKPFSIDPEIPARLVHANLTVAGVIVMEAERIRQIARANPEDEDTPGVSA
jgi:hypothetical protein